MRTSRDATFVSLILAVVVAWGVVGCASQGTRDTTSLESGERDTGGVACEMALVHLATLIDKRSGEAGFPPAKLIEARELHAVGRQLYLEREYELALELIEQAIDLLEEKDD
jgi:hypothetical protein